MFRRQPDGSIYQSRDRSLVKGEVKRALRTAFQRSQLHEEVMFRVAIIHSDPRKPRVKNWSYCELCGEVVPQWTVTVDHIDPVIPVDRAFEEMEIDEVVDRLFVPLDQLQALCTPCHDRKTEDEDAQRAAFKLQKKIALALNAS